MKTVKIEDENITLEIDEQEIDELRMILKTLRIRYDTEVWSNFPTYVWHITFNIVEFIEHTIIRGM